MKLERINREHASPMRVNRDGVTVGHIQRGDCWLWAAYDLKGERINRLGYTDAAGAGWAVVNHHEGAS